MRHDKSHGRSDHNTTFSKFNISRSYFLVLCTRQRNYAETSLSHLRELLWIPYFRNIIETNSLYYNSLPHLMHTISIKFISLQFRFYITYIIVYLFTIPDHWGKASKSYLKYYLCERNTFLFNFMKPFRGIKQFILLTHI